MMKFEDYENEIAVLHLRERLRNAEVARLTAEVERLTNERDASNRATERQWEAASQLRAEVARLTSELEKARALLSIHSGQWLEDAARRAGEGGSR